MTTDRKPCPACGKNIAVLAKKCRFCGEDLQAFANRQAAAIERKLFDAKMPMIHDVGQILLLVLASLLFLWPGAIVAFVYWLRATTTHYEVTTQRIVITSGIFSPHAENLELFRLDDLGVRRPILMRILGYGYVYVRTSDRTTPEVKIITKDCAPLAEHLRRCAFISRESRNVTVWANA